MVAPHTRPENPGAPAGEQRFRLSGVTWEQYEALRATLDSYPGLRMTYLEGELEIMSPSRDHEWIKTTLARLLETYALDVGLELSGYGSTTFKKQARERGLEPDECYCLGELKEVPDVAIEIALSSGGLDKLAVYAGLGVPEVWFFTRDASGQGKLSVHVLTGEAYEGRARSGLLPALDVDRLASFVRGTNQTAAVIAFRESLKR
jgi:Uma2 family endonuclease